MTQPNGFNSDEAILNWSNDGIEDNPDNDQTIRVAISSANGPLTLDDLADHDLTEMAVDDLDQIATANALNGNDGFDDLDDQWGF